MKVSELRELYAKTIGSEWVSSAIVDRRCVFNYEDAAFIAASHNAMPELLDTIDALMKRLGHAEQVIKRVQIGCNGIIDPELTDYDCGYNTAIWAFNNMLGDYADRGEIDG